MVPRKQPIRLEDMAFAAWLTALDAGARVSSSAPPPMLTRALQAGKQLREATIIRIMAAATVVGVYGLYVKGEFLNQAMLQQIVGSLTSKLPLEKLSLDLSPRIMDASAVSMLSNALRHSSHLQELSLTEGACDEMLFAIAKAAPPLVHLDLAYSHHVTDAGIQALLGMSQARANLGVKGSSSRPMQDLLYLNLWGTRVTTRGCVLILKHCPNLKTLSSCWTSEALVLLEMQKSNPLSLEKLLISEEELNGTLFEAITNLCPCLKVLTVRRPKDYDIDIATLTSALPNLKELSALLFCPPNPTVLEIPNAATLNSLHLSPLGAPTVYLDALLTSCPALKDLILEGVTPALMNSSLLTSKEMTISTHISLKELKILTAPISNPLDPNVVVWFVSLMKELDRLHLGCCKLFFDEHILELIQKSCLKQVEKICLSGATNLTDAVIHSLAQECPRLKCLVLKMLRKERLAQLESLKVDFRTNNFDLELITYGHRF